MIFLGPLGFIQPWILAGLLALPLLWYLLRLVPPQPQKIWFPPLRLLAGLAPKEQSPDKSPWWLLLLRMLLLALVITAFARPVWNPGRIGTGEAMNTVIVVDNGWTAASNWNLRKETIENLLSQSEQNDSRVVLAVTSFNPSVFDAEKELQFQGPQKIRERLAGFDPTPYEPARRQALNLLTKHLSDKGSMRIVWLSDGLDHGAVEFFAEGLQKLAGPSGKFEIFRNSTETALGLYIQPDRDGFDAHVIRSEGNVRSGLVYAWNAKGERLGEARFNFADGEKTTKAEFRMPNAIRNQVSRLSIAGENSAGSVFLLDSRSLRYKVGVISGAASDHSQPLLSPVYYIEKALKPYAEVISSRENNISVALEAIQENKPSVMVLADIGKLVDEDIQRMNAWVEKGGMLVRFAGPRMEKQSDSLLPVVLRRGGRILGGALSWGEPQGIAPFEKHSPFYGLEASSEIKVKRQVLADPSLLSSESEVWARLQDGTPLVTAKKAGEGWLVLFHVTANSEWSNLPLSGMFVEMLRRLNDLSRPGLQVDRGGAQAAKGGSSSAETLDKQVVPPFQVLNGFGQLESPTVDHKPVDARTIGTSKPRFGTPPGYYGVTDTMIAFNITGPKTVLRPLNLLPKGALVQGYAVADILLLFPWFVISALALLFIDTLIWLYMTRQNSMIAVRSGIVLSLICTFLVPGDKVLASENEKSRMDFALKASTGTHLAYVITGDPETDRISKYGLSGLSRVIAVRTAVEPSDPIGVDLKTDELEFFPILYWPIQVGASPLPDKILAKVDAYMRRGGLILFDTRDYQSSSANLELGSSPAMLTLQRLVGKLNIPQLSPVVEGHVVTKSFYLLKSFPGRWDGGKLWAEASTHPETGDKERVRQADGVSSILITSNDFAGAWALDENNRPLLPTVPGGELQREMAFRSGINIVMYALTGNYKADQVHVPALLERLGQ